MSYETHQHLHLFAKGVTFIAHENSGCNREDRHITIDHKETLRVSEQDLSDSGDKTVSNAKITRLQYARNRRVHFEMVRGRKFRQ